MRFRSRRLVEYSFEPASHDGWRQARLGQTAPQILQSRKRGPQSVFTAMSFDGTELTRYRSLSANRYRRAHRSQLDTPHSRIRRHKGSFAVCRVQDHSTQSSEQQGHSVLMHVTGFLPYFYVAAPRDFVQSDCEGFRTHLNVRPAICPYS